MSKDIDGYVPPIPGSRAVSTRHRTFEGPSLKFESSYQGCSFGYGRWMCGVLAGNLGQFYGRMGNIVLRIQNEGRMVIIVAK